MLHEFKDGIHFFKIRANNVTIEVSGKDARGAIQDFANTIASNIGGYDFFLMAFPTLKQDLLDRAQAAERRAAEEKLQEKVDETLTLLGAFNGN